MNTANTTESLSPIAPLDLQAERDFLGAELEERVLAVLRSGRYVLGPEVEAFEAEFAELCGCRYGVGVASGTDALVLALRALGIGHGDGVITSPFTFFASAASIAWIGAKPQLADVELETGLLDLELASAAVNAETKAVMPVHLYGQMADVRGLRELCNRHDLKLIEDAAQAHGSSRQGLRPGEIGDAAAFSFYPTKNLGAAGEGGIVVTNSEQTAEQLRQLRDHGSPQKYVHAHVGTNSRLHAMQATVLRTKLPHLPNWNARRRELAKLYEQIFANCDEVNAPYQHSGVEHAFHQYTVRINAPRAGQAADAARERVRTGLAERQIHAAVHYPAPVHLQTAAADWGYAPGAFPNAEQLCSEVLCLPVHPFLSDADVQRVGEAVVELAKA